MDAMRPADRSFFPASCACGLLFSSAERAEGRAGREFLATGYAGALHEAFLHDFLPVEYFPLNKINQKQPDGDGAENDEVVPERHQVQRLQDFKEVLEKVLRDDVDDQFNHFQDDGQRGDHQ